MTYAEARLLLNKKQSGEPLTEAENRLLPKALRLVANYWGAPR